MKILPRLAEPGGGEHPGHMDVDRSFAEFVSARWSMLYRLAVLLVGKDAAEDLAVSALAQSFASWRELKDEPTADDRVKAILARIASTSDAAIARAGEGRGLRGRLEALPPRWRTVVVLHFYELLTEVEIAKAVGGKAAGVAGEVAEARAGLQASDDELAEALAVAAGEAEVPLPPIGRVLELARRERAQRRRRALGWTGAAAAVAVVALIAASMLEAQGPHRPGSGSSSPAAQPVPTALAGLPVGAPPDVVYAVRRTLNVGSGVAIRLAERPSSIVEAGPWVLVAFRTGTILQVDRETLRSWSVTTTAKGGTVVADPQGHYVGWISHEGRATVMLTYVGTEGPQSFETEQHFPAVDPRCCDDPFVVNGVMASGDVVASQPARNLVWVWRALDRSGANPHPARIEGIGNGFVLQVLPGEVVVQYPPNHFAIGTINGDAFLVRDDIAAAIADFGDPSAGHVVYAAADGEVHAREQRTGDTTKTLRDVTLRLPALDGFAAARWEDGDHVLLDVSDRSAPDGVLVRCDVDTGGCEIAVRFDGPHQIAG